MRLQLLREVASFGTDVNMMKLIYIQIIRVILEGSCQVWHSSLTNRNRKYLERCQIMALRIILPKLSYKAALSFLNLETLENRRNRLTLKFAKQAKEHEKLSHLFKKNNQTHQMKMPLCMLFSADESRESPREAANHWGVGVCGDG